MGVEIKTEGIIRNFKVADTTVRALRGVSIDIAKDTLTILRGRSGSGKTTLINIIGTLDLPTEGKVFSDGIELTNLSETERDEFRRKNVGFVFQSVALISTMSAYENVDFALRVAGYPADKRDERVKECLEMVGLLNRMNHKPFELSGGEQQRVAIARAISHNPGLIIADEPTAELDTATSLMIVELFKKVSKENNITIVMTTHDPTMLSVADRVYTLEDGEIIDGE
jgi:putative ABC transport system ATP-binding protein